eukprot:c9782_g1_i1.p1 GENE.c9782_g1_i1~~c9782_g1_i1.p1  ORF type:complete len:196 (-),score=72.12 c9782_g1_i1:59-646(-)
MQAEEFIRWEYLRICTNPICGIYLLPSKQTKFKWEGIIFIGNTNSLYFDIPIHFNINFPSNYPNSCPEVIFSSKIAHPWVAATSGKVHIPYGIVSGWSSKRHDVRTILKFIVYLFNSKPVFPTSHENEKYNSEVLKSVLENKKNISKITSVDGSPFVLNPRVDETKVAEVWEILKENKNESNGANILKRISEIEK